MPAITPDEDIGIAFDMHGCPNRCRHCWLDHQVVATPRTRMTEEEVRWAAAQFGAFRRPGGEWTRCSGEGVGDAPSTL
jgi:hypothetical protein